MLKHIEVEHEEGVVAGGFEESVIPLKLGEAIRGAFAIQGLEELALRVVALELRVHAGRKEKKKCGGQHELSIASGGQEKF